MENHKRPRCEDFMVEENTENKRLRMSTRESPDTELIVNGVQILNFDSVKKYLQTALNQITYFKYCFDSTSEMTVKSPVNNVNVKGHRISKEIINRIDKAHNRSQDISLCYIKEEKKTNNHIDNNIKSKENSIINESPSNERKKVMTENDKEADTQQDVIVIRDDENSDNNENTIIGNSETVKVLKDTERSKEERNTICDKAENSSPKCTGQFMNGETVTCENEKHTEESIGSWAHLLVESTDSDSSGTETKNTNIKKNSHLHLKNNERPKRVEPTNLRKELPIAHIILNSSRASIMEVVECLENAGLKGVDDVVITKNRLLYCCAIVTFNDQQNLQKALDLNKKVFFNNHPVVIKKFRDPHGRSNNNVKGEKKPQKVNKHKEKKAKHFNKSIPVAVEPKGQTCINGIGVRDNKSETIVEDTNKQNQNRKKKRKKQKIKQL